MVILAEVLVLSLIKVGALRRDREEDQSWVGTGVPIGERAVVLGWARPGRTVTLVAH